jgi:hypothetical protein
VTRANWIGAPQMFDLNMACGAVAQAYGPDLYLVGSSLVRRDFRDVDIRCILDDADFDRRFPDYHHGAGYLNAEWALLCAAISMWLSARSGLPVDFQFQRRTQANAEFEGQRSAVGMTIRSTPTPEAKP